MRVEVTQGGQTDPLQCKRCGSEDLADPTYEESAGPGPTRLRIRATCNTCGNASDWMYTNPSVHTYANPRPTESFPDSITCQECGLSAHAQLPYRIANGGADIAYRCENDHTVMHRVPVS